MSPGLERLAPAACASAPHAGEAVGLQLQPHREVVGPARDRALLAPDLRSRSRAAFCTWWPISCAITYASGEVAGRAEALLELVEERRGRGRPAGRRDSRTARARRAPCRTPVPASSRVNSTTAVSVVRDAGPVEDVVPGVLDVVGHGVDEPPGRIVRVDLRVEPGPTVPRAVEGREGVAETPLPPPSSFGTPGSADDHEDRPPTPMPTALAHGGSRRRLRLPGRGTGRPPPPSGLAERRSTTPPSLRRILLSFMAASLGGTASVTEVARAGEHDRHPPLLGRRQDLLVAPRPSRVDHGRAARRRPRPRARRGTGRTRRRRPPRPRARSPALRAAIHDESTRDIWPAPTPTVAPSFTNTIVFDFTRHATVHASSRSSHSCGRSARGSRPPSNRRASRRACRGPARAHRRGAGRTSEADSPEHGCRDDAQVGSVRERRGRGGRERGRDHDLGEDVGHRRAASTSHSPWNATIPPNADTSSQANAAR